MRLLGIAFAVSFMLGCSLSPQTAEPLPIPDAPARAGPELEWLVGSREDQAWLLFGPRESDNVEVQFECAIGSGVLIAEAFDPRREGTQLTLVSGDVRGEFPATPLRDETGEFFAPSVKARARIELPQPVIAEFMRTGVLASGDPPSPMRAATPEELSRIQSFFSSCASS